MHIIVLKLIKCRNNIEWCDNYATIKKALFTLFSLDFKLTMLLNVVLI